MLIASEGIDVSDAQHPASIDWARVRAEGISGVYCQAREGTTEADAAFAAHVRAAHSAGCQSCSKLCSQAPGRRQSMGSSGAAVSGMSLSSGRA